MRSYIEISKENLLHNYQSIRGHVPRLPAGKAGETEIIAVVKGNAYGHGLHQVVSVLKSEVKYFGVDSVEELRQIRSSTDKPVFVMGYVMESDLETILELKAEVVMYDIDRLEVLNNLAKKKGIVVSVHIKIDAGLSRQGVLLEDIEGFIKQVKRFECIAIVGVYAHFANLEDTDNFFYAQKQIDMLEEAVDMFRKAGSVDVKHHISATAGALVYEKGHNDLVRVGLGLYGMWPAAHTKESCSTVELKPVMRWISHVAQVKTLAPGTQIGYGCTYTTQRETRIAVVPQGYADGYPRALSNRGCVLIGGLRCPVLGRVAMNMVVVDVSQVSGVSRESEVVLLGTQGGETITAEEIAEKLDTINYEVTTQVSSLLPRVIV